MINFDQFGSAIDLKRCATTDYNELLLHILTKMSEKIHQLELQAAASNELLAQLRDSEGDQLLSFDERVLEVLDARSGSARDALGLADTITDKLVLSAIEENSGEAFGHIEAEIEEKIDGLLEGHAFAEAVTDAVQGSLHGIVEEILDGIIADAITDALGDPEDIVRKGLRSIL